MMYKARLHWQPISILLALAMTWGSTMALVKIGARELAPLFMCGIRSVIAGVCLMIWMKARGVPLFPSRIAVVHGIVVGMLFGTEFAFIYLSLTVNLASRVYLLLYTAPFFVALGAHFFLPDDRLSFIKLGGLMFAFCGAAVLFVHDLHSFSFKPMPGDWLALSAAAVWGATTIYVKKFLANRTRPVQSLFFQVLFSTPLLLFLSLVFEDTLISGFSPITAFSVFYQSIIIVFISFVVWFELIHRYPVSLLHAFSFFTPFFGVLFSGVFILKEPITYNLIIALILISIGMVLVNYSPEK